MPCRLAAPPFGGDADARRTPDRTFQGATTSRTAGSAYWGENDARLLAIKARYDPHRLFVVRRGVGGEG
jgi:hypothetical protein